MSNQPRTLVIINPVSARARSHWQRIEKILRQRGAGFELHETTRAGDATDATRAALQSGYELIAVVGGDGTLSEAAAGFFEFGEGESETHHELPAQVKPSAALAILPAGTGNDFARGLAGGRESIEKWCASLVKYQRGEDGRSRLTDVIHGSVNGGAQAFICLNVATLGIGADVAARVGAQGPLICKLPGEARFLAAACGALARWRESAVRVSVDEGATFECRTNLIAVANGRYAGGGMMFSPGAKIDDGRLDLVMVCDFKRAAIVRELMRIHKGGHVANSKVRVIGATRVRVETKDGESALLVEADGNVRGHTPAVFRIIPRALRIVV